jgi:ribonuclease HI
MQSKLDHSLVYTDGACSGNPGPGGWGAIVVNSDAQVRELGGKDSSTTNNRMELSAALAVLKFLKDDPHPIEFYTDSTYLIRGITQWIWAWQRREWQNAEGEAVSNRDLWEEIFKLVMARPKEGAIRWHYSRGHVGIPGNERCDQIAVDFSKGKWVDLYDGPLLKYPVAVFDLPEDTSLPEMKSKTEKVKAYSYLSFLNGEVWRHSDWGSCERRVKGQSGAKFKKAMSAQDELAILASWGLSPSTKIRQ